MYSTDSPKLRNLCCSIVSMCLVLSALGICVSCTQKDNSTSPIPAPITSADEPGGEAPPPDPQLDEGLLTNQDAVELPAGVAATVNGKPILEKDLVEGLPETLFSLLVEDAKSMRLERRIYAIKVDDFLNKSGIIVSTARVDIEIEKMKKTPPSVGCACCLFKSLDVFMKTYYYTMAELREETRVNLGIDDYLERRWEEEKPPKATLLEQAKDRRRQLEKEFIKVSHIFFNTFQDQDLGQDRNAVLADKKNLARKAWKRLKAGESFAAVAEDVSEDQISRPKGGALGYIHIPENRYGKAFSKAAYALADGTYSEPVATPWGVHIIRRDAMTDEDMLSILETLFKDDAIDELAEKLDKETIIVRGPGQQRP